jgi:hypothetical protein
MCCLSIDTTWCGASSVSEVCIKNCDATVSIFFPKRIQTWRHTSSFCQRGCRPDVCMHVLQNPAKVCVPSSRSKQPTFSDDCEQCDIGQQIRAGQLFSSQRTFFQVQTTSLFYVRSCVWPSAVMTGSRITSIVNGHWKESKTKEVTVPAAAGSASADGSGIFILVQKSK